MATNRRHEEQTTERGTGSPAGFEGSAANIAHFLSGIDFPAHREDLVQHASQHNASQKVKEILENLPDANYTNMADVMKGLKEEKRTHGK